MDNNMDNNSNNIIVLMVCPVSNYLEQEIEKSFKVFKLWHFEDKEQFINTHKDSIQAVVGSAAAGADAELIESLPKLEIVTTYSVGLDKIDLARCKEKGIRVANTPDVLTDDVADLAIGLILAVLRRICESDRYVRSGEWKKGEFKLTTKVFSFCFFISIWNISLKVECVSFYLLTWMSEFRKKFNCRSV